VAAAIQALPSSQTLFDLSVNVLIKSFSINSAVLSVFEILLCEEGDQS
jgi:hypothetical protein